MNRNYADMIAVTSDLDCARTPNRVVAIEALYMQLRVGYQNFIFQVDDVTLLTPISHSCSFFIVFVCGVISASL